MRRPQDLSHAELADLVQGLVDKTFMVHYEEDEAVRYDPQKQVDLIDSLRHLGEVLMLNGLAPRFYADHPDLREDRGGKDDDRLELSHTDLAAELGYEGDL